MTTQADLVNLALQSFGSRTTLTAAQLEAGSNNEAKQAILTYDNTRNSLLRMAPWNCALKTANLTYVTSIPGTTENISPEMPVWAPGLPRPPWAYEYQYPVDCLRPCWIIPSERNVLAPVVYKVGVDSFYSISAAIVNVQGAGYAVGDEITLAYGPRDKPPIGAPAVLRVLTLNGDAVATVEVISQVLGADPPMGGSYFFRPATVQPQWMTTGLGLGASFTVTSELKADQRVILTNQPSATMVYVKQVPDPNVWDPLFQDAFYNSLGANLCMALTGDKSLANLCIQMANRSIETARKADGNEGLVINDITPDWIRARGINFASGATPWSAGSFDWGGLLSTY